MIKTQKTLFGMNKLLLLISCSFFSFLDVNAQSTIAKFKYEEAEAAYANGNYKETLDKLDETIQLLGSNNNKILYLQIMAGAAIVRKNPLGDWPTLEKLNINVTKYLTDNDGNAAVEDKYREVYEISKELKSYPQSQEQLNQKERELKEQKEQQIIDKERALSDKRIFFYNYNPLGVPFGIEFDELRKDYPEVMKDCTPFNDRTRYCKPWKYSGKGARTIYLTNDRSRMIGYEYLFHGGSGYTWEELKAYANNFVNEMSEKFGFRPSFKSYTKGNGSGNTENAPLYVYTWELEDKLIRFNISYNWYPRFESEIYMDVFKCRNCAKY